MIDFSNFYQLIAKSPLSHWLETLPARSRLAARCAARQVS